MGNKRLDSFFDCMRWGFGVEMLCPRCGYRRIVWTIGDSMFSIRGKKALAPSMALWAARQRLKCGRCGHKPPSVRPCDKRA